MFKHILVPVDGSEHAGRAVDIAGDLAQRYGAKVTLLHVLTQAGGYQVPSELLAFEKIEHLRITEHDLIEGAGQEILTKAEQRARNHGAADCATLLESGDPAGHVVQTANGQNVDLIVMGRRGLGDLGGLLLGSVSHKVSQAVDCCCLTVK
ncbi:universal stress protein [Pelagibius marinus]|uniref:universal stress protein n=1 Tax=Pelagibius marinus TaxID=2762760 RepID=UPI0018726C32|nr:universal stress protein [Pelagibius marinus]